MNYLAIIVAAIINVILSWFISVLNVTTLMRGLKIGFLGWLGFTTTAQILNSWVFSGDKPKELYLINTGYHLVISLSWVQS